MECTKKKQGWIWIVVAVVSALVAAATVIVLLRKHLKKEEFEDVECITYDFEPEELAFDDEFLPEDADTVIDEIVEAVEEEAQEEE